MTPEETAAATAKPVNRVPGRFMLDATTYARGVELGFSGLDFYVAGRGGVLGEVHADVVCAAFVFFPPGWVRTHWEAGRKVMPPSSAALRFLEVAAEWARERWPEGVSPERVGQLAERAARSAPAAGAPLLAGWRQVEPPAHAPGAALHWLNCLRELRGAMHACATLAHGLSPLEAVLVGGGAATAQMFEWPEPYPDVSGLQATWDEAEAATNRMCAPAFAALEAAERGELVELLTALRHGTA